MSTESDAGAFTSPKEKPAIPNQSSKANAKAEAMKKHFSNVFGGKNAPFFSTATVTTEPPPVDWDNFAKMFSGPAVYVPAEKAAPTKYTKATYNFINSKVENAALGNKGSVTFNKKKEVYQPGAKKTEFNISGGNFAQANIGGKAEFHNKSSDVGAGTGAGGGDVEPGHSSKFIDISKAPHPFSPEEYLFKLLQTGVTSEELIGLLEKNYSIVDLSYSLPSSEKKRAVLIDTLLKIVEME